MITTPGTERRDRIIAALLTPRYGGPQHRNHGGLPITATPEEARRHRAGEIADIVIAAALTEAERRLLTFALNLAADRMLSEDGFTDEDGAALESLRRMAAAARPDNTTGTTPAAPTTPRCATCSHTKRDHSGRADHRARHSALVAGDPWCHACNARCDFAEPTARPDNREEL